MFGSIPSLQNKWSWHNALSEGTGARVR